MAQRIILTSSGLTISKPGKNATSTNLDDLLFSMTRVHTKRSVFGTVSTGVGATKEQSVAHGLGFVPIFHVDLYSQSNGNMPFFSVDSSKYYYYTAGNNVLRYTLYNSQWV